MYQTKPTKPNLPIQIKFRLPSILNQAYQAKIIGQSSQHLGPQCLWQCFPSTLESLAFLSGLQDIYFPDILLFSLQFKLAENYFPAQMRKLYFAPFKLGSNSHQHWIHISHRETSYEESPNTSNDIHHFDLILICRLQLLVFKVCC